MNTLFDRKETEGRRPRKQYGQYRVLHYPKGGFKVFGPGIRPRGVYVPPDEVLRKKFEKGKSWKTRPGSLKHELRYRAVIEPENKPSMPVARKALGLEEYDWGLPKEEVIAFLRAKFPTHKIESYIRGEERPPTIEKLRSTKKGERMIHSAHRGHGGLESVFLEAFPEHPRFYDLVYNREHLDEDLDPEHLRKNLIDLFFEDGDISVSGLRHSKELFKRKLHSRVLSWAHGQTLGRKRKSASYTEAVKKLTGLSPSDIQVYKKSMKNTGIMTENMVYMVARWANQLGLNIAELTDGYEVENNGTTRFSLAKRRKHSDLRAGNAAIEIKSGKAKFAPSAVRQLVERYSPGKNSWESGEPIGRPRVLFYMEPHLYSDIESTLTDAAITVIPHSWFSEKLQEMVEKMKKHPEVLSTIKPRLHSLDYLISLDRELLECPAVLARTNNLSRMIWTKRLLKNIAQISDRLPQSKDETINESMQGEIVRSQGGAFMLLKRNLSQLTDNPDYFQYEHMLRDYAKEIADAQTNNHHRIHIPEGRLAFLDIESCGLNPADPIFSVSITEPKENDLITTALVARDYSEEKPMLSYLLSVLPGYSAVYTFNGSSFDLTRLDSRLRANCLRVDGGKTLRETLDSKHVDLYREHFYYDQGDSPDKKQKSFEILQLGMERKNDIPSSKVAEAYTRYINRTGSTKKLARAIRHNMLDTNTLVGMLGHSLKSG